MGQLYLVRIYGGNNSIARRRSYFLRIVMRHKKLEEEVNTVYSRGQEIFIDNVIV